MKIVHKCYMQGFSILAMAAVAWAGDLSAVSNVSQPEGSVLLPSGKKFKLVWLDEFDGDRLGE